VNNEVGFGTRGGKRDKGEPGGLNAEFVRAKEEHDDQVGLLVDGSEALGP
jgi:hypothetical protein